MSAEKRATRDAVRAAVLERAGNRCEVCGLWSRDVQPALGVKLDAHHIIPRTEIANGGYVPSNLIALCDEGLGCHWKAERWPADHPTYGRAALFKRIGSSEAQARADAAKLSQPRTKIVARNARRTRALYTRNFGVDGRRGAAVRTMGCCIAGKAGHTCEWKHDACHSTARGMGGTKGDSGHLWNGCAAAHREAGERGTSQRAAFVAKYGADPEQRAAEVKAELDERFGPEPCWRCKGIGEHAPLCPTMEARTARR
jgi:hypothetical protein